MYGTRSVNLGTLLNLPVPVALTRKRNAFYFAYFHLTLVVFLCIFIFWRYFILTVFTNSCYPIDGRYRVDLAYTGCT